MTLCFTSFLIIFFAFFQVSYSSFSYCLSQMRKNLGTFWISFSFWRLYQIIDSTLNQNENASFFVLSLKCLQ